MVDESQDVLNSVRRKYDELTQSQKRIAEAIVEDPQFVAFATVDKLAERLSIAPSTVVRFAYKIGLNGYPDLQERVRQVVRGQLRGNGATGANAEEGLGDHLSGTQSASLLHDLENLRQTVLALDTELLSRAAKLLAESRQVFVVGGFASGALAAYTALTLERVRGQADLIEHHGGRHIPTLLEAGPQDTLVAIGFAPYSADTVQVIELAKDRGVRIVGITDTPISPIGQRVDIVLPARVSGVGAQNSLVAPVAIINVLLNETTTAVSGAVERYDVFMRSLHSAGLFVLSGSDGER